MPARRGATIPRLDVNMTNQVEEQWAKFVRGTTPWIVWLLGIPVGSGVFWAIGHLTHLRVAVAVCLAVSTLVVTKVTTRKAHGTGRGRFWEKLHHGLNAFVAMALITLVTWVGPLAWHGALVVAYFVLGLTGALVWNVRYSSHHDGAEDVLPAGRKAPADKRVDGAYVVRVAAGRAPVIRSVAEKAGKVVPALASPWREAPKAIEGADGPKAITAGDHVDAEGAQAAAAMWAQISRNWRDLAAHKVPDLNGAKLSLIDAKPWRVRSEAVLVRGVQTPKVVMDARELLASQCGMPLSGVIVKPNPRNHRRVFVDFVLEDVLATVRHWPGPHAIGQSIADAPVQFGVYEDRVFAESWETAISDEDAKRLGVPEQNLSHIIYEGMTGSGKSTNVRIIIAEGATRLDVEDWAIDTVKKYQTLGCVAGAINWFAAKPAEAKALARFLADVVIPGRANYLGMNGYDNWQKGCGIPFLRITIEEGGIIANELDKLDAVLNSARSAGVKIRASFQRAHHAVVDTNVRSAFGETMSYGVKTSEDVFAMDDELREAGADPSVWQDKQPGMMYRSAASIPFERRLMPVRSFKVDPAMCRDIVAAHVAAREAWIAANCPDWFQLLQEWDTRGIYAKRTTGAEVRAEIEQAEQRKAARAGGTAEVVQMPVRPQPVMTDEEEIVEAELVPDDPEDEITMSELDLPDDLTEGIGEDAATDPRQPIPPVTPDQAISFGRPEVQEMDRDTSLSLLRGRLMREKDGWEFLPRDLYDEICQATGRTAGWVRTQLSTTLMAEGLVSRDLDTGHYRVSLTLRERRESA